MDHIAPETVLSCGHWLDVLCYTFRAVSDPVKITFILALCALTGFVLYAFMNSVSAIAKIFWKRPACIRNTRRVMHLKD